MFTTVFAAITLKDALIYGVLILGVIALVLYLFRR